MPVNPRRLLFKFPNQKEVLSDLKLDWKNKIITPILEIEVMVYNLNIDKARKKSLI